MLSRRSFLAGSIALVPACSSNASTSPVAPEEGKEGERAAPPSSPDQNEPAPSAGTPLPDSGAQPATASCIESEDNPLGPYYMADAPKRTTLVEAGMPGTKLVVEGRVLGLGTTCTALADAEVDVWHADDAGDYDNIGFTLRGVFTTDASGKYRVETILPGRYLDGGEYRPRHIHVRVRAPGRKELVTQLYFTDDPFNATDGMYKPALAMTSKDDGNGGLVAAFDFVLRQ